MCRWLSPRLSPFSLVLIVGVLPQVVADEPKKTLAYAVRPIGKVEKADGKTTIVLDKKYQPGLLRLDKFSHVWVIWWFHKNDAPRKRAVLQVHPRGDKWNRTCADSPGRKN